MNPATEEIFARIMRVGFLLVVLYYLIWPIVRTIREKKPVGRMILNRIIVLGIMLLPAFLIPSFLHFSAPLHHQYIFNNLQSIAAAQEKYHSEHGVYAGGPNAFELLDWKSIAWYKYHFFWGERRKPNHAFFCGDDYIRNPTGEAIPRSARPAITASSSTGFICTAVGKFGETSKLDYWLVNDRGEIINSTSDRSRIGLNEQEMQDLFSSDHSRIPKKFIDQDGRLQLRR